MPDPPGQLSFDLPLLARATPAEARPEPPRQLALDLPVTASFDGEDFLLGPANAAAWALVDRWPDWPDPLLLLTGAPGSGKSHLASIWASRSGALIVPAAAVTRSMVPELGSVPALVVEDLDRGALDEAALFHLVNLGREKGHHLLATSAGPVGAGRIATPDLLSRLRRAPSVEIGPPDDALLKAILVKLFFDRQLLVDANVVDYLAARIERSPAAAREIVAALDREALSRGRRVTRAVAAAVLGAGGGDGAS